MTLHPDGERQLQQYLLGELAEEEQQRLEQQLLFDDERIEWLLIAEEELVDRYLRDQLSAPERARFETYFLSTPARRQKLLAAKALRRYIATATAAEPRQTPWWQRLFTPLDWKLAAVAGVLLLGLGLGIWRLVLSPSQMAVGMAALKKAYPQQRPIEARISGFDYAPLPTTRGERQKPLDPIAYGQAMTTLFNAASEHPNAETRHGLSYLYLLEQQIDQAREQLELALKADPSSARIHNDLGAVLMEMGKIEREKTEKSEPKSEPEPDDSLKTFARANEHFTQALHIDAKLAEALFNQALCYQYLQLTEQALEAWRQYLELDAQSPWASEANRHLKEVEDQKKKTAWEPKLFWQDFVTAYQASDEERLWETFNLAWERTGNVITQRLLDDYLQALAEGRRHEASQSLAMLARVGEIEKQKVGDSYTHDLARFYQNITPEQRASLMTARELFKAGGEKSRASQKKDALELYQRAEQTFAHARSECEAKLTEYLIGVTYARLSKYQQGGDLAEKLARYYAEDHHYRWLQVRAFCLLADLQTGINEYSQAIDYSKHALALSKQLQRPNDGFEMLGQLAEEYKFLGDYERSLSWHQRNLNLASRYPMDPSQQWPMYGAVSLTFSDLNLLFTAVAAQKEALYLASAMNRPLQMSRSHNYLGEIYGKLTNYGEAMKQFETALELSRSASSDGDAQNMQAHSLLRLGHIHRKVGNLAQALSYYNESSRLYQEMHRATPLFNAHRGKLLVYLAQRDDQSAQKELEITQQLLEQDSAKITEDSLRNSFFDAGQDIYDLAIQLYADNLRLPEEAFNYSERSRARSLLDLLQAGAHNGAERQMDEPQLPLATNPLTLSEIRRQMPPSVQIVQYAVLSEKLHIWVVSNSAFHSAASIIRLDELNSKVSDYLKSVVNAEAPEAQEADRLARELYDILIKPVESFLDVNREICFVPDETLNYLPFGALIEPASSKYLIEKYTLTLSPSATVFLKCTEAAGRKNLSAPERCLSVGQPSFDRDRFPHLPALPSTRQEAERVAGYYSSSRVLLAGEARESVLRREIQNAEVIHLASHSLVNERLPERSGVVLAKESSEAEPNADGLLEAREVSRLNLRQAKLVVLSACQTWLGRNYRGEGMVGLARAFIAADVPLVVASLWAVNDETTGEMMNSFHHYRTQGGLSTVQALRRAQLDMLQRPEAHYHKPFAWAAFVTIGGNAPY